MINKIRPIARVEWSDGNDGYDGRYYIAYYCPKCRRKLPGYAMMNACDQCGTFYDWGKREPVIEVARSVRWDGAGVPTAAAHYSVGEDPSLTLRMTEEVDRTDDVELGPWPSCGGAGAIPCAVREALAPAVRARYNAATKRGFYG